MRTKKVFLAIILMAVSTSKADNQSSPGQTQNGQILTPFSFIRSQTHPPVGFIPSSTPFDGKFVIRENEQYILGAIVTICHPPNPDPSFTLIEPAPSFLQIAPAGCQSNGNSMALLVANPIRGDAGTYNVQFGAQAGCGSDRLLVVIKVKKAKDE